MSLLGSARKEERGITETFEVHAEAKEQCLRIAAHMALGRLMERYARRLQGTVYYEMTRILPTGIIWPKKFKFVPRTICSGTLTYFIQSLEKHILNLEKSAQYDFYTIIEYQQTTHELKRTNWRLQ